MWARGGRVDQHYWNALWKWNWEIKGSNCKWIPPFFQEKETDMYTYTGTPYPCECLQKTEFTDLEIDEVTIDVSLGVQIGDPQVHLQPILVQTFVLLF